MRTRIWDPSFTSEDSGLLRLLCVEKPFLTPLQLLLHHGGGFPRVRRYVRYSARSSDPVDSVHRAQKGPLLRNGAVRRGIQGRLGRRRRVSHRRPPTVPAFHPQSRQHAVYPAPGPSAQPGLCPGAYSSHRLGQPSPSHGQRASHQDRLRDRHDTPRKRHLRKLSPSSLLSPFRSLPPEIANQLTRLPLRARRTN
jgi:hypothetical protein